MLITGSIFGSKENNTTSMEGRAVLERLYNNVQLHNQTMQNWIEFMLPPTIFAASGTVIVSAVTNYVVKLDKKMRRNGSDLKVGTNFAKFCTIISANRLNLGLNYGSECEFSSISHCGTNCRREEHWRMTLLVLA